MKINNLSNVSFKSVYIVEGPPKASYESETVPTRSTFTGELFDMLSLNGSNQQIALMKKGGMFKDDGVNRCLVDAIDVNSPPLLLVDGGSDQPAKRVKSFVKRTETRLKQVDKLDIEQLKSRLAKREIERALREANEETFLDAKTTLATGLTQKIKINAARRYKKIYEELAQQAIIIRLEAIDEIKQAIMDTAKLLSQFRK